MLKEIPNREDYVVTNRGNINTEDIYQFGIYIVLKNNIVVNGNNLAGEIFSGISYTNPETGEFLKQQFEETLDIN